MVRHDALIGWDMFVRVSEKKCVGPLLGEIVAVLLPHLPTFPSQVSANYSINLFSFFITIKAYKSFLWQ